MTRRFFNPDGTYEDKEDTDELNDLYVQDAINLPKQQWEVFRRERNRRLTETDYLALSDTVEMSDDWKTYRQALRDLPASSTPKLDSYNELDLTSVSWPTEPS